MYVKFNLMPDTYLVVTIVHGAWGGRGGNRRRRIFKGELKLTDKEKKKTTTYWRSEDILRTTVS